MKILFLANWLPYPPLNGAKVRIYNLVRELSAHHEVTLLAFAQTIPFEEVQKSREVLRQYCDSVDVVQAAAYEPRSLRARLGYLSLKPRSVVHARSREMEEVLNERLSSTSYDVVVASEVNAPSITSFLASRCQGLPVVLDGLEVELFRNQYLESRGAGSRFRNWLTWAKLRHFTKDVVDRSVACTVPSAKERDNLAAIAARTSIIEVLPHSLDLGLYEGPFGECEPGSIVFTGSFTYDANRDGAQWFLGDIYPDVRAHEPLASMKVVGQVSEVDKKRWSEPKAVEFTGLLKDVRPVVARSRVSVVPLRVGSGTRVKVIESMALGTPVVSTSKGAEGLDVTPGENILIADNAADFGAAVLRVLGDATLRERLSVAGRQLVARKYSKEAVGRQFRSLLDRVVGHPRASSS